MLGSTSGGKSGAANTPEKEDATALKGARPKEDTDRGTMCPNPNNDESTSRETFLQQSPSNLHTRECFALLFPVEVIPTIEDGVR